MKRLDSVHPAEDNPRHITPEALQRLADSIARDPDFMALRPIVHTEDGRIIGGNMRWRALQRLGKDEVPDDWLLCAADLTPEQIRRFIIVDNAPSGMAGTWDLDALANAWEPAELEELGFTAKELGVLGDEAASTGGETDPDAVPDVPPEPASQAGEVYALGKHRLFCGDSCEIVPGIGRFDLLLTDPPYGIGVDRLMAARGGQKPGRALAAKRRYQATGWDDKPVPQADIDSLLTVARHAAIWGGNYYAMPPSPAWLVWDKENGANYFADAELCWTNYGTAVRLKRHLWNGMLRKGKEPRMHPTQKPRDVMAWCIQQCPDDPQTVLDPYAGSGTTIIASETLGRACVAIEREPAYCDIIRRRWAEFVHGAGCDWQALTPVTA